MPHERLSCLDKTIQRHDRNYWRVALANRIGCGLAALRIRRQFQSKGPRAHLREALRIASAASADALPGLAAAEHAAKGATLNLQEVRAFHRDRRVVVPARVRIVNLAGPFAVRLLHIDEDPLAGLHGVAAEVLAARLDADIALVLFGGPNAERGGRGRRGGGRSGNGILLR